ncbi:aminotransferase class IV [Streptomyces sp. ODS28]|uniref:aminotransferase class IV n=1 Tax=Streptomyces sp. ODS28 TaxID=3136688 RepID=UPI0031EB911D
MRQYMEIDGEPAGPEGLGTALSGYGHFTYMQVRSRRVRGLDMHLERLDGATRELFGQPLEAARVLPLVRHALEAAGREDASVRVQVFAADTAALLSGAPADTRVLVMVRPPADPAETPLHLRTVTFERFLPHLKHLDTMGLLHAGRTARRDGFDDALLTDRTGHVSEASLANVVLYEGGADGGTAADGDGVFVWPDAPALPGIMRGLLRRGMTRLGLPYEDRPVHRDALPRFRSAFLVNSISPAQPVTSVDGTGFGAPAPDEAARRLLLKAYEANPWEALEG